MVAFLLASTLNPLLRNNYNFVALIRVLFLVKNAMSIYRAHY